MNQGKKFQLQTISPSKSQKELGLLKELIYLWEATEVYSKQKAGKPSLGSSL